MKFEAIFIDLDGTLLTDHLTISPGSVSILKKLADAGVLVCIVTARSPAASVHFYEQLGIVNNPIICFNGALIQKNNKTLYEITIENAIALEIIYTLKRYQISPSVYKHNDWFAESPDQWINQEMEITNSTFTEINFNELFGQSIKPNKLLGIAEPAKINAAEEHLKNSGLKDLSIHTSKPTYLEIMSNKASKNLGIQKVLKMINIDPDKIITIGDNYNDIDMLRFSKTSVAMGNAPDEVKKFATYVTDTNNNEGTQKALNFLL
jgi:Cof subfamily protein (haloacid dehalogenase superfamily)